MYILSESISLDVSYSKESIIQCYLCLSIECHLCLISGDPARLPGGGGEEGVRGGVEEEGEGEGDGQRDTRIR